MNQDRRKDDGVVYELDQYRQQNCNLLIPDIAIGGLSVFHKPVVDKVTLSPDEKQGDVYNDNNARGMVITGKGLAKLATTAGIIWDFNRCRRIDDRRDKNYCAFRAVGGLRKPDGAVVWADASYDIDFDVLWDQLQEKYAALAKQKNKDQAWADYCTSRDWNQKLTHKLKLCETGAKNRVIRKLLGIKSTYTQGELAKPFVCPRIVFQPDYDDPDVKKAVLEAHIQSMTGLYGPSSSGQPTSPSVDDHLEPEEAPDDDIMDPDLPIEEDVIEGASLRQDFIDDDLAGKIKTLKILAGRKGYDLRQLKKPMDQWADDHLLGFYDNLEAMKDDDVPY